MHSNIDTDSVKRNVASMGLVTMDAFPVQNRSTDPHDDTNVIGSANGRGVFDVHINSVLARALPIECSEQDEMMTGASSSRAERNLVFASANGLNSSTRIGVAGVAMTQHSGTSVTCEKVTYTTTGMVTINNNSPHSIAAGDTVLVHLPWRGGDGRFIKAPIDRRMESDAYPLQICSANKYNTQYFSRHHSIEFNEFEEEIERRIHAADNERHTFTYKELLEVIEKLCAYEDEDVNVSKHMHIRISDTAIVKRINNQHLYEVTDRKEGISRFHSDLKSDINAFMQTMESERIRTQRRDGFIVYSAVQQSLKLVVSTSARESHLCDDEIALLLLYIDARFNHETLLVASRQSRLAYDNIVGIAMKDTSRLEPLTVLMS